MNIAQRFYLFLRKYLLNIDDRSPLDIAISNGLKIGKNCHIMGECILDPGHCFLIKIGNNVTLAPRVHILTHDASTKRNLGYTLIGKVEIGDNVFVGAGTIILPNVKIGNNVIVGAGSVVTHSIPSSSVYAGNPARYISSFDSYIDKRQKEFTNAPVYDESYKIDVITEHQKEKMRLELDNDKIGFII